MDVRVELLTDDVWASEYDKTGFLSVGVDVFESVIFEIKTDFLDPGEN